MCITNNKTSICRLFVRCLHHELNVRLAIFKRGKFVLGQYLGQGNPIQWIETVTYGRQIFSTRFRTFFDIVLFSEILWVSLEILKIPS